MIGARKTVADGARCVEFVVLCDVSASRHPCPNAQNSQSNQPHAPDERRSVTASLRSSTFIATIQIHSDKGFGESRRFGPRRAHSIESKGLDFTLAARKVSRATYHRFEQCLIDKIDHKLAAAHDISQRVLNFSRAITPFRVNLHTEDDQWRIVADIVEGAEWCCIAAAILIQRRDECDRSRNDPTQ
jgi:hypothetical protein